MSYDPAAGDGIVVLTTGASAARDGNGIYAVCGDIARYFYELTKGAAAGSAVPVEIAEAPASSGTVLVEIAEAPGSSDTVLVEIAEAAQ